MRYKVGEHYVFCRVLFKPNPANLFRSLYIPWEDYLEKIEIMSLKCTEHHKVAWDQDPNGEKKHNGFLFVGNGETWSSQYPFASYGQLDDSCDWLVNRYPFEDDTYTKPFRLATSLLSEIHRAILHEFFTEGQKVLLKEHIANISLQVEKASGGKIVVCRPLSIKKKDGTEVY